MTIKKRWEELRSEREGPLRRARQAAELTIPSIMVPEGANAMSELVEPYQSLGARGVNNLASKLLLALLPPATPFFRLSMTNAVLEGMGAKKSDAEAALRKIEESTMQGVERSNLRTVLHGGLRHLVVVGDVLMYLPQDRKFRYFGLDKYMVARDPSGTVMEIVIKQSVNPSTLPDKVQEVCKCDAPNMKKSKRKTVDIYTHVQLIKGRHISHEEINDTEVPGSKGSWKVDESPFIPLRWTAVSGEDYGRGMVEEYIGDLRSLEGLNMAIVSFAAAASKILLMLKPNSTLTKEDLANTQSGDVVEGDRQDIDVLQIEKFNDYQVAKGVSDDLTLRISHAFLLSSGTVRNAERVTAEEIRQQAQELEDVLGGVYSVLAQELQVPLVNRLMAISRQAKEIPPLPAGAVSPTIVTGFEALGRGHELNKLRAYFADIQGVFGPEAMAWFKTDKGLQIFATQHNIDIDDIVKTIEEFAQEQQQNQTAALAQQVAAPVANNLTKPQA